jgi:aldose 1-epimerase
MAGDEPGHAQGAANVGRLMAAPGHVVLSAGPTTAEIVPALGGICCSLEHDGVQVLGLRKGLAAYAEAGTTMGIPLLHPWANRLPRPAYRAAGRSVTVDPGARHVHLDPNGLPIHGVFGAALPFRPAGHDASSLTAVLDSADSPELTAVFPFTHRVDLEVRVRPGVLEISTTLTATGRDAVPVAFGYHPYLQLAGVPRSQWRVDAPVRTRLQLDDRMIPTGETSDEPFPSGALGTRAFDDAYTGVADGSTFTLGGGGRRVSVRFLHGYPVAQVFAPADQDVVCFEPMTAPGNALVSGRGLRLLDPGASHRAGFTVSVE